MSSINSGVPRLSVDGFDHLDDESLVARSLFFPEESLRNPPSEPARPCLFICWCLKRGECLHHTEVSFLAILLGILGDLANRDMPGYVKNQLNALQSLYQALRFLDDSHCEVLKREDATVDVHFL